VSRLGGVGSRKKDCGKIQDLTPREPRISRPDPSAALPESRYCINVQCTSAYIAAEPYLGQNLDKINLFILGLTILKSSDTLVPSAKALANIALYRWTWGWC